MADNIALDIAAIIVPIVIVVIQAIISFIRDSRNEKSNRDWQRERDNDLNEFRKERDEIIHEWDLKSESDFATLNNNLILTRGRLDRGCVYYDKAIGLIDDVASELSYSTQLFISKVNGMGDTSDKTKQSLDNLMKMRGKIAATLSNEMLVSYTNYTQYLGNCMGQFALKNELDQKTIDELTRKETETLIDLREEKIRLQCDLFGGRTFTKPK